MNRLTYCFRRIGLILSGRVRKHTVFLSLGRNCEVAFRYFKRNGFVESSLFQWSGFYTFPMLIAGLERFDEIFAGEIRGPNPLYTCLRTNLRAHGKLPQTTWEKGVTDENRAAAEEDCKDLVGRMAHLKAKFRTQLRSGGAFVVCKIRTEDWMADACEGQVKRLYELLLGFGAVDFDLVLVLEKACRSKLLTLNLSRVFVRYVDKFNPEDKVTDMSVGDRWGWRLVFDEFVPRVRQKQKHKFKFEH